MRSFFLWVLLVILASPVGVVWVEANSLDVATTVVLEDGVFAQEGAVVVHNSENDAYGIAEGVDAPQVFGVVAVKPSLVFSTGVNQVPVVTGGVSLVRVDNTNGVIARGDVLITGSSTGVAVRAGAHDKNVFAIALEGGESEEKNEVYLIQAQIGVTDAVAAHASQQEQVDESQIVEEESEYNLASIIRAAIATVLAIGGLVFVLYSFRSTIAQGVVSVGRNPRARRSIVTLAFGNIVFALILCAVVVFIAVAVLILPLQ